MRFLAPIFVLLALALPASAVAQTQTNAPPGNSGLSQYLEVVPTASGSRPSSSKKKASTGTSTTSGAATTAPQVTAVAEKRAKLASSSKDGQKLDEFAGDPAATPKKAVLLKADSKAASVAGSVTGSGSSVGMGLWMPIAMAALAVIALFAGWRRRRNPEES